MAAVVGVDLSSFAVDLVKLDEDSNRAEWVRCELSGDDAWERTLSIRSWLCGGIGDLTPEWWEDVYLVAIEAPYGYGSDLLNRVVGAIAASLPARLRAPERCWIVRPDEWKTGLGLKGKPTWVDIDKLIGEGPVAPPTAISLPKSKWVDAQQNFRDAYCIALFARETNARAVDVSEEATG